MSAQIEYLQGRAFLSFPEMKDLLLAELEERFGISAADAVHYGDLVYLSNYPAEEKTPYWSRTAMVKPFILRFDSIKAASSELRKIQRSWAPYSFTCFRRTALIQENLPYVNLKARNFPVKIPSSPIGLYVLLDEHTILASAQTTSFLPAGTLLFNEDHENPPSRAYLKIQESLSLAQNFFSVELPGPGDYCFEAGACPGGWTWVLAGLGAEVFAVDRAELAPSLMKNPLVTFSAHDAFTLTPEEVGECKWVFSDVICYPERLLEWIKKWISSGKTKNMICTIKMQGKINWELVKEFENIPDSRIVHLNYNKHELTFIHCGK